MLKDVLLVVLSVHGHVVSAWRRSSETPRLNRGCHDSCSSEVTGEVRRVPCLSPWRRQPCLHRLASLPPSLRIASRFHERRACCARRD